MHSGVLLTDFRLIGSGGEHLVFLSPDEKYVVKLNYVFLTELKANKECVEEQVQRRNQEAILLREYFGDHMPISISKVEKVILSKDQLVRISKQIDLEMAQLHTLFGIDSTSENFTFELEALITIQPAFSLDKDSATSFGIDSYNPENEVAIVKATTEDFFCNQGDIHNYETQIKELYPSLSVLVVQAKKNKNFAKALRDFVIRLIHFTKETSKAIDFEGRGNIFFIDEGKAVEYILSDVLQAEPKNFLESFDIFYKKRNGELNVKSNINDIVFPEIYQFRGLNLLAAVLNVPNRIDGFTQKNTEARFGRDLLAQYIADVKKMIEERDSILHKNDVD